MHPNASASQVRWQSIPKPKGLITNEYLLCFSQTSSLFVQISSQRPSVDVVMTDARRLAAATHQQEKDGWKKGDSGAAPLP